MTPGQLFYRRLLFEWKFQYRVVKTVIDWTVALYLVVPAIGMVVYQYYEWWHNPPAFLTLVPSEIFLAMLFLFSWFSPVRIFIEEGDQLFLFSLKRWRNGIVIRGLIYSCLLFIGTSLIFFCALIPLALLSGQFTFNELLLLLPFTILAKIVLGLSKQFLTLRFQGWKAFVLSKGLLVLSAIIFIQSAVLSLSSLKLYFTVLSVWGLVSIYLLRKRINYRGNFFGDIQRELEERLKYVGVLVNLSGVKVRKSKRKNRRPWLFPKSGRIFKTNDPIHGLIELALKSTLRNRRYFLQYSQVLGIMVVVLVLMPDSLSWLAWIVFSYVFGHFAGSFWAEVVAADSFPLIRWQEEHLIYAKQKFVTLLALPAIIIMGLIVVLPLLM